MAFSKDEQQYTCTSFCDTYISWQESTEKHPWITYNCCPLYSGTHRHPAAVVYTDITQVPDIAAHSWHGDQASVPHLQGEVRPTQALPGLVPETGQTYCLPFCTGL